MVVGGGHGSQEKGNGNCSAQRRATATQRQRPGERDLSRAPGWIGHKRQRCFPSRSKRTAPSARRPRVASTRSPKPVRGATTSSNLRAARARWPAAGPPTAPRQPCLWLGRSHGSDSSAPRDCCHACPPAGVSRHPVRRRPPPFGDRSVGRRRHSEASAAYERRRRMRRRSSYASCGESPPPNSP